MENVLKVAVMLSAVDKMTSVIKRATDSGIKDLTRLSKEADRISRSAFDLGRSAGAFGLAVAAPLGLAVNAAAKYEQMQVALNTAFQGNKKAADDAFKAISDFAAKTPYEMQEVMTGFIKLKNMGLDPSIDALTAYGNTASAMGKSLNDMIEAVADAATGEFERLKEFGIRAKSQGDQVSFTFQGVTTTVGKNAAEIEEYLKKIGATKFAGGIEAQSKTFNGQLSTFKDNITMFAASIGNILIPVLNDLMQRVTPIIEKIQKWTQAHPTLTRYIILGAAALAGLSLAVSLASFLFGGLAKIVSVVSTTVRVLTSVVQFSTKAVGWMSRAVMFGSSVLSGLRSVIIRVIGSLFSWKTVTWLQTAAQYAMNTAMTVGRSVMMLFSGGLRFVGQTIQWLTRIMWANPILAIIGLIAMAVYWIYENWDGISQWFSDLWDSTSKIFSAGWQRLTEIASKPVVWIMGVWNKIKGFFSDLWKAVKQPFVDFYNFLGSMGDKLFEAGSNIINSIWDGMKKSWNEMIEWWKKGFQELREYLPFSPAKRGPLRDIHRVKLVETIAQSVKPAPLVRAMESVTGAVRNAVPQGTGLGSAFSGGSSPQLALAGAGGRGNVVVNFSPVINMTGGGKEESKDDFLKMLKQYEPDLMRLIESAVSRRERTRFS